MMKKAILCAASLLLIAAPVLAQAPVPSAQPSVADFARLPLFETVQLSPDGTHITGLMAVQGKQLIAIMNPFDKAANPVLVNIPDGTEAHWVRWVNNDNVIVGLSTLLPLNFERWTFSRVLAVNRVTGKQTKLAWDLEGQGASVIWIPTDGSSSILLSAQASVFNAELFWPAVYRVDAASGRKSEIVHGQKDVLNWDVDSAGRVRVGTGYVDLERTFRLLYRGEKEGAFQVIAKADTRKEETLVNPLLFVPGTDNALVFQTDDKGVDSIAEIDLRTRATIKTVYAAPGGASVREALISADGLNLIGVVNSDNKDRLVWLDPGLKRVQVGLDLMAQGRRARIISYSKDRTRFLVKIDRPDSPGAIFFYDVANPRLQMLAQLNETLGMRPLNPVKAITYKARDGLEIEAILTLPMHKPAKGLPIVVLPHGGPWGHDTLDYDYWAQFVASRGYAVIQPNFRGSTGYGQEFVDAGKGQMGLKMQDDVTDALNWAAAEGIADPKRACIMGASYGGYAAMWGAIKDPDAYRCAISISGVANLRREVNDFGSTLLGRKFTADWKAMTPDFAAVSPINGVERIKAPLLLVHGKKDITVDSGQSDAMHAKMRGAGKRVEYLALPEADHYFTRQADREALLGAVDKFLAQHNPPG